MTCQQTTRPSKPSLDFIENKNNPVLITPLTQHLKKRCRGRHKSTLTSNRLNNDRRNILFTNLGSCHLSKRIKHLSAETPLERTFRCLWTPPRISLHSRPSIKIRVWSSIYLGRKWSKSTFIRMSLCSKCHRHVRAAMISMLKRNNRLPTSFHTSKLNRVLNSFRTRVCQKCFAGSSFW